MTPSPKEKAKELQNQMFQKIFDIDNGVHVIHDKERYIASIQCALISINDTLEATKRKVTINNQETDVYHPYHLEVKQELEKL
jgi:hypothetical protein